MSVFLKGETTVNNYILLRLETIFPRETYEDLILIPTPMYREYKDTLQQGMGALSDFLTKYDFDCICDILPPFTITHYEYEQMEKINDQFGVVLLAQPHYNYRYVDF